MDEQVTITDWFASLYLQSKESISFVLDLLRKNGEDVREFVVIVADLRDEATRFFVDQLGEAPVDPTMPGFVGAVPKSDVARVLRLMDAEPFADDLANVPSDGHMRLLIATRGQMQCAELPLALPMSPGGSA